MANTTNLKMKIVRTETEIKTQTLIKEAANHNIIENRIILRNTKKELKDLITKIKPFDIEAIVTGLVIYNLKANEINFKDIATILGISMSVLNMYRWRFRKYCINSDPVFNKYFPRLSKKIPIHNEILAIRKTMNGKNNSSN